MMLALTEAVVPGEILIVEDEQMAREALAELLQRRGFEVKLAETGSHAIVQATQGELGVVVMDIVLDQEMNGFEAAAGIQRLQPFTSFIFVTGYARVPEYQERRARLRTSTVRVGGWLEKPIGDKVDTLVALIQDQLIRLKVLRLLARVRSDGGNPVDAFSHLAGTLPENVARDVLAELERAADEPPDDDWSCALRPGPQPADNPLEQVATKIDEVYAQLYDAVGRRMSDGEAEHEVALLVSRLESLWEEEADVMEQIFRAQLEFDPEEGRAFLRQIGAVRGVRR